MKGRPGDLLKLNARLVPSQHTPFQPPSIYTLDLLRQLLEQPRAVSSAAKLLLDEKVLEIDARSPSPGRVVVEVQRHARRLRFRARGEEEQSPGVASADRAVGGKGCECEGGQERGFCGEDGVRLTLV